jgi:alkylation response protein AidB-like acyl-CoA dehydrogenase
MQKELKRGAEYLITGCPAGSVFTPEDFDAEQKALAETIEQFVANEVLPNVEKLENHDFQLMVSLLKKSGELGFLMIEAPEKYGGLELGKTTSMLASEKIAPYGSFMVAYLVLTGIGLLPLVYYGNEKQKEKYLGKLITGEWMSAYCLTEPDAGSDALGAKTTATLSADGKHYILNGTKQFISNGSFADLYTVFAKIDRKHFTAFLVERSFPGVTPGPQEKKLGIKGSSTTQLILEDAKVPVENVLGEVGKGHKIAFNVLNVGRFKLGAVSTGAAKTAFVEAVKYANMRKQFGVPIGTFGAIREKIADMAAYIFASESLVYRLAGMIDDRLATIPRDTTNYYDAYQQGIEEYAVECSISKVFCTDMLAQVVDEVLQVHGGYGFVQEYPAERFYRDERVNRIYEGTNEINRILISGTLIKRLMKHGDRFEQEVRNAREAMKSPSSGGGGASGAFSGEEAALRNLKHVFLALAGTAVETFGDRIKEEQEILIALADVAASIFAIESVVARAGKIEPSLSPAGRDNVRAAVKVFTLQAVETVATAARKAAFIVGGENRPDGLLQGIRNLAEYDASGLVQAKRKLADAALDAEKYIF